MFRFKGEDAVLVEKVKEYVEEYMSQYDGSHDFSHILRVLGLAQHIASSSSFTYDPLLLTLAALMHDIGDKKYVKPGEDSSTLALNVLMKLGMAAEKAGQIQLIVSNVSYSSEMKDSERVQVLCDRFPELAIVQDADRLDAIGAVGVGRTFTYGGAKGVPKGGASRERGMDETILHFTDKLENLEEMMKTEEGKKMAKERTKRLKLFRGWWAEEIAVAEQGLALPGTDEQ